MKTRYSILLPTLALVALGLSSCLNDKEESDSGWRDRNERYVAEAEQSGEYERLTPPWAPQAFTLVKWHNDRTLTNRNLSPLDNSLCDVKYELLDIDEKVLDTSFKMTTYGDSIYRSRPSANITGFWYLLTQMHVGDSVTAVLPAISAYGSVKYGDIKANTTLIYRVKLVGIPAYEIPL